MRPRRNPALLALAAVLVLGAVARLWLAATDDGIFFPDEIFQTLEPAHRRAFGYALLPWEFIDGARSWLLPSLLAPLLRLGAALGGDRPRAYLLLVRVVFVAASMASAYGAWQVARKLGVAPARAVVAAALFALLPPAIYFAPHAFSENLAALPIVFAVALLCDESPSPRAVVAAGVLLGVATIFRVQNGLVCATAVGWLLARRDRRGAALLFAVLAAMALVDGALDRITWGRWFQSAEVYLRANFGGYSDIFGRQPPTYYLRALVSSSGAAGVLVLALAAIGCARARGVGAIVVVYLVAHSFVGLKQLRFALPVLPLVCALAAVGVDVLARWRPRVGAVAAAAAVAAVTYAATTVPRLTYFALGANYLGATPVLDHGGAYNRALAEAHDRADLCGLKLPTDRPGSGGMSWLHRRVHVYGADNAPPAAARRYNYEIALSRDGRATLRALGFADCAPDPSYRWRAN